MTQSATIRGAFAGMRLPSNQERVLASELMDVQKVAVMGYRTRMHALQQIVATHYAVQLPHEPRRVARADIAFLGLAPQTWLVTLEGRSAQLAFVLRKQLHGVAAVSEQSDALGLLRLTGRYAREALSRLIPIDVHERAFARDQVASTGAISSVPVTLWRVQDHPGGWPTFDIAVPRSLAESFSHALLKASR